MSRTLVVTNDFPPRPGGIQTFVDELLRRLPDGEVVVLASSWRGSAEHDADYPHPVVRYPRRLMLPTPDVSRLARGLLAEHGCTRVLFGAAAPLGLLAGPLRAAGAQRLVGLTHGHEAGWAGLPGSRQLLRRSAAGLDVLTYLTEYTRERIAAAVGPRQAASMRQLTPGVATDRFTPSVDGSGVRRRWGLGDDPVVVCVSRLMPRKGQDTLVGVLPALRQAVPGTRLLLVGGGPERDRLARLAAALGVADAVVLTGSVPPADLPALYAAGDVFAMPCRTRLRGLDVEGLGIVFLEASASGLPVVAGRSGGAPDAVEDQVSGLVVDGSDAEAVRRALVGLLGDPPRAAAMGEAGVRWAGQWTWQRSAQRLTALLDGQDPDAEGVS